jgi:hypothetical protein
MKKLSEKCSDVADTTQLLRLKTETCSKKIFTFVEKLGRYVVVLAVFVLCGAMGVAILRLAPQAASHCGSYFPR